MAYRVDGKLIRTIDRAVIEAERVFQTRGIVVEIVQTIPDGLCDAYRYHRQAWPSGKPYLAIEAARRDVATGKTRFPYSGKPYAGNWETEFTGAENRAYFCPDFPEGWRNLGNVGEIRTETTMRGRFVEHTGWYTDDDQSETVAGYVLQLPARHGKPLYIPGIFWTGSDGVSIYPNDMHDDIGECARAADQIAKRLGEAEQDYRRADHAGQRAAGLNAESKSLRKQIVTAISDLRAARSAIDPSIDGGTDTDNALLRLCDLVRDKVSDLLAEMYETREKRDNLREEYGSEAAFNESYNHGEG